MKIKSVIISNILSIESAEIKFDDNGLILVSGWNYDSGRANGAGKTAIFNAITFALYDKLPRKITATEILRRDCKTGYCQVTLTVGEDEYVVKRHRPKNVVFYKNGAQIDITQDEWESTIKLNYAQYLISAYCAQGGSTRFLSINDSDKKQFLLQLLNLEEFASCKSISDHKIKSLNEELKTTQAKIQAIDSKIEAYSESLIDEDECRLVIEQHKNAIDEFTKEIITAQQVSKPDISKFQKLEDEISAKKTEQSKARLKREMLHDQYRKLTSKIKPFNKEDICRACGTQLDTSSARSAHEKEILEFKNELQQLKVQIDECDELLLRETETNDLMSKLKDKKREVTKNYESASMRIIELQSKVSIIQKSIEDVNLKLLKSEELHNKINTLKLARAKCSTIGANIIKDIEFYEIVSSMYSSTGAQAYVLDSVIDSFNQRVSEHINLLWCNMTYQLLSYKENVKGDVTAKFSEQLTMDGKPISIGSLSGGEFRALSLCVDFALINIMESHFGISISPITLDEPFDGLDTSGKELIIDLLKTLAEDRQIIIIDHASEIAASFSGTWKVEKRNGVSTVLMIE